MTRQRLDLPAHDFDMELISLNGSESNPPRSDCINKITSPKVNQKAYEMRLKIKRDVSEISVRRTMEKHEVTTGIECLHMVTDTVLVIFAVIIAVSIFVSIGIFILGQYRISRGLDDYLMTFEEE